MVHTQRTAGLFGKARLILIISLQGEGKEGVINLVISFSSVPRPNQAQAVQQEADEVATAAAGKSNEICNNFIFSNPIVHGGRS